MQPTSAHGTPGFAGYHAVDGDGDIFMADAQPREHSRAPRGIPAAPDGSQQHPHGSFQQGLQSRPGPMPFRSRPTSFVRPPTAPSTSSDRLNSAANPFDNHLRHLPRPNPGGASIVHPPVMFFPQSVRRTTLGNSEPPTLPPLSSIIPGPYRGEGFQDAAAQSAPLSRDGPRSGAVDPTQNSLPPHTPRLPGIDTDFYYPTPLWDMTQRLSSWEAFLIARPGPNGPFHYGPAIRPPRPQTPPHVHRRRLTRPSTPKVSCTVCLEEFKRSHLVQLACNCCYCTPCLNLSFKAGCANMASFPPKCCAKPLRISVWGSMLDPEVLDRYKEIEAEFSANRPLYCASPKCSAFIPESDMLIDEEVGLCPKCATSTCRRCRRLKDDHAIWAISERVCPKQEESLTKLYQLGSDKKWKQCPTCLNMVEKTEGCNHMDCVCGVEFCYRCGNLFDEDDACECEPNSWDNEDEGDDGEEDDDDDDEDEDDDDGDEEDEDGGSDEEEWPDYRVAVDPAGRPRCLHSDLSPLGTNQHTCHGCLQRNILLTCVNCALELCQTCVDKSRNAAGGGDDTDVEFMGLDHRGMERDSTLEDIREWLGGPNPYARSMFR